MKTQLKTLTNPINELINVRAEMKALKAIESQLKRQLTNLLDEQGVDTLDINGQSILRKMTERNSLDGKNLKVDHPALFEKYSKKTLVTTLKTN